MLTEKATRRLQSLSDYLDENKNSLIIDGDTHPTDIAELEGEILTRYQSTSSYYHGRPISDSELIESMNAAAIDMSLIWQNPAAFCYSDRIDQNFEYLLRANKAIDRFASQSPTRFIPAGWTDPKSLGTEGALKLVDILIGELGFPIVKMNPAQNSYPIDSPEVFKVVQRITELGATPAFHFGGDSPYTPASRLERIVRQFPESTIIGVHMGGGGSHYVDGDNTYIEARELGLKFTNLFYVLSAKRDTHMESDLIRYTSQGPPFNENMAWGSDAPYGLQSWNIGGFMKMFETLTDRPSLIKKSANGDRPLFDLLVGQRYLGTNLANLVITSCRRVLKTAGKDSVMDRTQSLL